MLISCLVLSCQLHVSAGGRTYLDVKFVVNACLYCIPGMLNADISDIQHAAVRHVKTHWQLDLEIRSANIASNTIASFNIQLFDWQW